MRLLWTPQEKHWQKVAHFVYRDLFAKQSRPILRKNRDQNESASWNPSFLTQPQTPFGGRLRGHKFPEMRRSRKHAEQREERGPVWIQTSFLNPIFQLPEVGSWTWGCKFFRPRKTYSGEFGIFPHHLKICFFPFFVEKIVFAYLKTIFRLKPCSLPFNWLSVPG